MIMMIQAKNTHTAIQYNQRCKNGGGTKEVHPPSATETVLNWKTRWIERKSEIHMNWCMFHFLLTINIIHYNDKSKGSRKYKSKIHFAIIQFMPFYWFACVILYNAHTVLHDPCFNVSCSIIIIISPYSSMVMDRCSRTQQEFVHAVFFLSFSFSFYFYFWPNTFSMIS